LINLQTFLGRQRTKLFKKGDVILQQDVEPSCVYIVKQGVIKTYNITSKGEEKPIGFNVQDDLFPLGWALGKISRSQYYYEALSDCRVYSVPRMDLMNYLHSNTRAMFQVLDRCAWEMLIHQMHINALEQSKAYEKVVHTLHYLSLCFGHELRTDMVEIPLPITQQDVANFTGLTRETVSVELKKLATEKVVFSRNRNYVVLTDKLNELLDDEYERRLIR
jgi:CRP/FNR family transcriptional regulator